jgi:hypothetical protein
MRYYTRVSGSQRSSSSVKIEVESMPSDGDNRIIFKTGNRYHIIEPENYQDLLDIKNQVDIIYLNMKKREALKNDTSTHR